MKLSLALLAVFVLASVPSTAKTQDEPTTLDLTTEYIFIPISVTNHFRPEHRYRLLIELDGNSGKGKLVVDPNAWSFNAFGDPIGTTQVGLQEIEVTLEITKPEIPEGFPQELNEAKGRKLYEIMGKDLTCRAFLVVSPKQAGPNRLIFKGARLGGGRGQPDREVGGGGNRGGFQFGGRFGGREGFSGGGGQVLGVGPHQSTSKDGGGDKGSGAINVFELRIAGDDK